MTETDELTAALDAAARLWPGLSRPQLLVRLALAGDDAARRAQQDRRRRRLAALGEHRGVLTGAYGPGHVRSLHEEWPA